MQEGEVVAGDAEHLLLRRAIDSLTAMLAYWDSTLRCRFANRAYQTWFGVSPESMIGRHISELLGPIYELNRPHIEGALRGDAQVFEREIPDPAGGPPRHSLAHYIPDIVDGVVGGFFAHVTDISQLKRTELALRESEAKYSGIVSISADAIITIDEAQRITIFNDGAERIFGYARREVIGAPLDVLLPARFWEVHRRHVAAFLGAPATSRQMGERGANIVGIRKTGEEFPAEAAISKLEIGDRRLLTVALRDITERKRVQREQETLAEAGAAIVSSLNCRETLEAIARLVVSRVADLCGIYLFDGPEPMRVTLTANEPAKASVCEQLARRPLSQSYVRSWPVAQTGRAELIADVTPERLERLAQDPEHLRLLRELDPRSSLTAPLSAGGRVFGALLLASSTPARFAERDVAFAMELARRAGLAIENARLYEAAQRATRARDEVLAVVAHDVRNPLATIQLAAVALERDLERDGASAHSRKLAVISRSVDRANRLIQDLLDTTRIDAGALSIARAPLDTRQVLADVVEAQRPLASSADIALDLDVPEALPALWADRDRVLQVFENLVGNAIKFTPAGGRITIGAVPKVGEVLFRVADTGAGIREENLAHIFDRFWRAPGEVRRGAGLGLPIAKGIVEAHGGHLWVESQPGRGTVFYFTIASASSGATRP